MRSRSTVRPGRGAGERGRTILRYEEQERTGKKELARKRRRPAGEGPPPACAEPPPPVTPPEPEQRPEPEPAQEPTPEPDREPGGTVGEDTGQEPLCALAGEGIEEVKERVEVTVTPEEIEALWSTELMDLIHDTAEVYAEAAAGKILLSETDRGGDAAAGNDEEAWPGPQEPATFTDGETRAPEAPAPAEPDLLHDGAMWQIDEEAVWRQLTTDTHQDRQPQRRLPAGVESWKEGLRREHEGSEEAARRLLEFQAGDPLREGNDTPDGSGPEAASEEEPLAPAGQEVEETSPATDSDADTGEAETGEGMPDAILFTPDPEPEPEPEWQQQESPEESFAGEGDDEGIVLEEPDDAGSLGNDGEGEPTVPVPAAPEHEDLTGDETPEANEGAIGEGEAPEEDEEGDDGIVLEEPDAEEGTPPTEEPAPAATADPGPGGPIEEQVAILQESVTAHGKTERARDARIQELYLDMVASAARQDETDKALETVQNDLSEVRVDVAANSRAAVETMAAVRSLRGRLHAGAPAAGFRGVTGWLMIIALLAVSWAVVLYLKTGNLHLALGSAAAANVLGSLAVMAGRD